MRENVNKIHRYQTTYYWPAYTRGGRLVTVVGVCLSSSVTLPASEPVGRRARGRSGGRHRTAGQYGYVPLGRHLV